MPLEELLASYYREDGDSGPPSENSDNENKVGVANLEKHPLTRIEPPILQEILERSSDQSDREQPLWQQEEGPPMAHVPPDLLLPPGLMDDTASETSSNANIEGNKPIPATTGKRKGPWFRPGANPEALARLRPVPERRSMKLYGETLDNTFS